MSAGACAALGGWAGEANSGSGVHDGAGLELNPESNLGSDFESGGVAGRAGGFAEAGALPAKMPVALPAAAGALEDGAAGLKICVKLPSAEAESETPGLEKPFILDGAGGVAGGGGVNCACGGEGGSGGGSITVFAATGFSGTEPAIKMRVNSPGPELAAGAVAGSLLAAETSAGAGATAFSNLPIAGLSITGLSIAWKIRVNSPGPDFVAGAGGGAACAGQSLRTGSGTGRAAPNAGVSSAVAGGFSSERRNIAVALSGSSCSGGFDPEEDS